MSFSFIVLDGIDGVGKTTTALKLAEQIGGNYYKMPPSVFEEFQFANNMSTIGTLRHHIDNLGNVHVRFLFYLMCAVYASPIIEDLLKSGHVICDRYLPSTLAYHRAMDSSLSDFNVDHLNILLPDYEIHLVADEKIRKARIRQRANYSVSDLALESNQELLSKAILEFDSLGMIKVDTTNRTVDEVVEYIIKKALSL